MSRRRFRLSVECLDSRLTLDGSVGAVVAPATAVVTAANSPLPPLSPMDPNWMPIMKPAPVIVNPMTV